METDCSLHHPLRADTPRGTIDSGTPIKLNRDKSSNLFNIDAMLAIFIVIFRDFTKSRNDGIQSRDT